MAISTQIRTRPMPADGAQDAGAGTPAPQRTSATDIHPALWRASQLARGTGRTVDTGYAALSEALPGGGWPLGALAELMVQQAGVGELRLLAPALVRLAAPARERGQPAARDVALLQPPHLPNAQGLDWIGVAPSQVLLLRPANTADALWTAEQVLKAGTCAALLFWQQHIRADSLRRLHLAAKSADTLFIVLRPLAAAADPSPAELRLALRPVEEGVQVDILKRKGPAMAAPLSITLVQSPVLWSPHRQRRKTGAPVQRPLSPVAISAREGALATVGLSDDDD